MVLTKTQKLFISFSNLLGAKYFKRYWPVHGSFWNSKHIDKNNRYDLNEVIHQANEFTRQHIQILIIYTLIYIGDHFVGDSTHNMNLFKFIILPLELYAFMINHYNRILANERLSQLINDQLGCYPLDDQDNDHTSELEQINLRQMIEIRCAYDSWVYRRDAEKQTIPLYYYLVLGNDGQKLSPAILNVSDAIEFRDFLYTESKNDFFKLSEFVFYGQVKQKYLAWSSRG